MVGKGVIKIYSIFFSLYFILTQGHLKAQLKSATYRGGKCLLPVSQTVSHLLEKVKKKLLKNFFLLLMLGLIRAPRLTFEWKQYIFAGQWTTRTKHILLSFALWLWAWRYRSKGDCFQMIVKEFISNACWVWRVIFFPIHFQFYSLFHLWPQVLSSILS